MFTQKQIEETFELLDLGTDESREKYSFDLIQEWDKKEDQVSLIESHSSILTLKENA